MITKTNIYKYDNKGNVIEQINPNRSKCIWVYDDKGNVIKKNIRRD